MVIATMKEHQVRMAHAGRHGIPGVKGICFEKPNTDVGWFGGSLPDEGDRCPSAPVVRCTWSGDESICWGKLTRV